MKTSKWVGIAPAISPYALPAGANQTQNNLQSRKVAQLTSRPALGEPIYVQGSPTAITGSHRMTFGTGKLDNLVVTRESDSGSTEMAVLAPASPFVANQWVASPIFSYVDQLALPTFCQDRHGTLYAFWGRGIPPQAYRPDIDTVSQSMGLVAPQVAPTVVTAGNGYFIERVDVLSGGGGYWTSPTLVVSGGSPVTAARLKAIVQGGSVTAVDVIDGGAGYQTLPTIVVDETGVKGGGFVGIGVLGTDLGVQGLAAAFTKTVDSISGGNTLNFANAADRDAVKVGMYVTGTNVPTTGTVVTSVSTGANTATVDRAVTNSATAQTLTFSSGLKTAGTYTNTNTHSFDNSTTPSVAVASGASTVSYPATYSSASGTYVATIPLTPNGTSRGIGAQALVTFSPAAAGGGTSFSLGGADTTGKWEINQSTFGTTSKTFNDYGATYFNNRMTLRVSDGVHANYRFATNNLDYFPAITHGLNLRFHSKMAFLLDTYSVFTVYSTYVPDYRTISYRYFTGTPAELDTASDTDSKWVWAEAPVLVTGSGVPYVDITLQPCKKSTGVDFARRADAVLPVVRIYLTYCPDDWLWHNVPSAGNVPFAGIYHGSYAGWYRGAADYTRTLPGTMTTNKRWWHPGDSRNPAGILSRPVVDFRASSSSASGAGITSQTVAVEQAGSGLEKGTFFALHFEQANAVKWSAFAAQQVASSNYDGLAHYTPYSSLTGRNTTAIAVSDLDRNPALATWNAANSNALAFNTTNCRRFYFSANASEAAGAVGPVGAVLTNSPPTVLSGGAFFNAGETASFQLRQRSPTGTAFTDSETYTFRAAQLTAAGTTRQITGVTILRQGAGYNTQPELIVTGGGGAGLALSATVSGGAVTGVAIADPGTGYTSGPTISTSTQTATVIPVLRPAMRGVYRCAYRFADWRATVVSTVTATTTSGSPTVTLSAVSPDLKVGFVLEMTGIPWQSKVISIVGNTITLNSNATAAVASGSCVVRDMSQPIIYSDFSPITDVDTSTSLTRTPSEMVWAINGGQPPARAQFVEFFRTSSDQSLVFYRIEQYGVVANAGITIVGKDTLTDEQLFDPDRNFYAAMPVVLPNGAVNAYRFGVPRTDMSAAVAWSDRLWYGVSTSGEKPNDLFFSEYDEFESCPASNHLTIQNNHRSADAVRALVPFGPSLVVFQSQHAHALNYNTDPAIDASLSLVAHRGCISQRCFDVYEFKLYVMDERGIYVMTPDGDVESLSDPIQNFFFDGLIQFSRRDRFFLKVEPTTKILRAFVSLSGSVTPDTALCYRITDKSWWTETYPNGITSATDFRQDATSVERPVYTCVDGNIYAHGGTLDYPYRPITSVAVTNGGSGYTTAPAVSVAAGQLGEGAQLQALVRDGSVTHVVVKSGGWGYGTLTDDANPDTPAVFNGVVNLTIAPPPSGTTATATGTALSPTSGSRLSVGWHFQTGNMEFMSDGNAKNGERMMDRSVVLTYQPTETSRTCVLREYFNNAPMPRAVVTARDRGAGWVHDVGSNGTTLDLSAGRSTLGSSTGVAKAQFAGRSIEDTAGGDRHISVELSCPALVTAASPAVAIYALEVRGVVDGN